jgi:hypothetical protein
MEVERLASGAVAVEFDRNPGLESRPERENLHPRCGSEGKLEIAAGMPHRHVAFRRGES